MRLRTSPPDLDRADASRSSPALAGPDGAQVVGGSATVQRPGHRQRHRQPVQPERHHQLAHVQHRRRRAHAVHPAEQLRRSSSTASPADSGHRRSSAAIDANGRVFVVNRDGIIFGAGAVINTGGLPRDHERHQERRLHGGPLQLQHPGPAGCLDRQHGDDHGGERRLRGAGRAGRAQLRHHHGDARHGRACAPATPSRSTSTATS